MYAILIASREVRDWQEAAERVTRSRHGLSGPPELLHTEGFVLRSYRPGDGALLTDAVDESYAHLAPWMAWAASHQSLETSERVARQSRGRYLLAQDFTTGIFAPDESRLLGGTGFHLREGPLATRSVGVGMRIPLGGSSRASRTVKRQFLPPACERQQARNRPRSRPQEPSPLETGGRRREHARQLSSCQRRNASLRRALPHGPPSIPGPASFDSAFGSLLRARAR
jgi:hypothetical protein